jgi:hypothetical protein
VRIPDLKTAKKERGEKKFAEEKNLGQFSKNYRTFYSKNWLKIWAWDLGSEIRKKSIPDPRSRIQGSKMHRIPDPDPQHCPVQYAPEPLVLYRSD